jgi:hypothetical protein
MKRQRRDLKCQQALHAAGAAEVLAGAFGGKRSRPAHQPSNRPATDEDNWDVEPEQIAGMVAMGFPVKIVQTVQ